MPRITLISPPYRSAYTRNSRCDLVSPASFTWYPIWLAEAGAWCESKGHQTQLIDAQTSRLSQTQTLDAIKNFNPDVVAVYTGRLSEDSDIAFADTLAAQGRTTVFVGPYASADPAALLKKTKHATLTIQKEFDLPLEELASGANPATTPNVWIKNKSGEITNTPPRPFYKTETLDGFPITSRYINERLNIKNYRIPSERYPFLDVLSGRGCSWGRCAFCLWTHTFITGSQYNQRSIPRFMQEFEYIRDHMPFIKSVMIQDDMITNKRAAEIAEALLERNIKIKWSCYAKPNSKLTPETLKLMKRSGCLNLHVGFESGNDAILRGIDKGTTVEQAKEFGAMIHKAKLRICGEFTFGHIGETFETMQDTLALAKAVNPHLAHFLVMIPLKGTPFWDKLQSAGSMNAADQPSYETLGGPSADDLAAAAKSAYRKFYLSGRYLINFLEAPDLLLSRLALSPRLLLSLFSPYYPGHTNKS
jgi:anaerobic magnesium-protoporphyrin IX monomethyl ester cyclase